MVYRILPLLLLPACGGIALDPNGSSPGSAPSSSPGSSGTGATTPGDPGTAPSPGDTEPVPLGPGTLEDMDCVVGGERYSFATNKWRPAAFSINSGPPFPSTALFDNHLLRCAVNSQSVGVLDLSTMQEQTFYTACENIASAGGKIILEHSLGQFKSAKSLSALETGALQDERIVFPGARTLLGGLGNALSGTWHASNEFVHYDLNTQRSTVVRIKTYEGSIWGTSPLPGNRVAIVAEGNMPTDRTLLVFDMQGNELRAIPVPSEGNGLLCFERSAIR